MDWRPVIGPVVAISVVLIGATLFGGWAGRQKNLETSPDWDEAWLRVQQARAYLLEGDMFHVNLRLKEAMHHADQLPQNQRAVLHEEIMEIEGEMF